MESTPSVFLLISDQQAGPFTDDDLRAKLASGEITDDTLAWKDGMAEWAPVHTLGLSRPKLKIRKPAEPDPAVSPAATTSVPSAQPEQPPPSPAVTAAIRRCATCQSSVMDTYYVINGNTVCTKCHSEAHEQLLGGSGFIRFVRASAAGLAAGLVGFGIYYGVAALTGRHFALIAIVVGLMVGFAVKWGSINRGGWPYQLLAMFLTYTAIVASFVPIMIEEVEQEDALEALAGSAADGEEASTESAASSSTNDPPVAAATASSPAPPRSPGRTVLMWVILLPFAYAVPFVGGVSIIGIIIIGFGVYEAWHLNKREPVEITGPHTAAGPGSSA